MVSNQKPDKSVVVELAIVSTKLDAVQAELHEVKKKLDAKYVTVSQFEPIKKIVYGMVALILVAVVTSAIKVVLG